jgi:spoIIIJ-associated protein
MSEQNATLEVIAPTVDEAVTKGLDDLGLPREAVNVEILDEGSRGFLGLGTRQVRVRLTVKGQGDESTLPPDEEIAVVDVEQPVTKPKPSQQRADIEEEFVLESARETVSELLEKMKIRAEVTSRIGEMDDPKRRPPVIVDINGQDLSILIGRRAATLNALQYIARLIVSKELGRSVLLVIDVEGYRERRERQLQQLARRMAEQAITTGRRQALEPMPANERRIIHIELRSNAEVTTESVGDEPRRKVTINPQD